MKHVKNLTILAAVFFFAAYLLGAFYEANINLSEWDASTRSGIIGGYLTSLVIGGLVYAMARDFDAPN